MGGGVLAETRRIGKVCLAQGRVEVTYVLPTCGMRVRNCHEAKQFEIVGVNLAEGRMMLVDVNADRGGSLLPRTVQITPEWMAIEPVEAES